jgi:hypothetical protein
MTDWYDNRDKLECDWIFRTHDGFVKLDRRVPGDGSKWYVADWSDYCAGWGYEDGTLEPGELIEKMPDGYQPYATT